MEWWFINLMFTYLIWFGGLLTYLVGVFVVGMFVWVVMSYYFVILFIVVWVLLLYWFCDLFILFIGFTLLFDCFGLICDFHLI